MKPEPWQAVGNELKRRWRLHRANAKPPTAETITQLPEFNKAILSYLQGDHAKLAEYLCTHPISREEQAEVAWALEERARPKLGRPESLEHMNRKGLAEEALFFYRCWKDENARLDVKDWGHREDMKRQACEFVVELAELAGRTAEDVEAIWELVTQPKSRRK